MTFYNPTRSAFRCHHSSETALAKLIDIWTTNMENGQLNSFIFVNLRRSLWPCRYKYSVSQISTLPLWWIIHILIYLLPAMLKPMCPIQVFYIINNTSYTWGPARQHLGPLIVHHIYEWLATEYNVQHWHVCRWLICLY